MATHKVKAGQSVDNWKDKVVIRTETKEVETELTYAELEIQLESEKKYLEIVKATIADLEDKLAKIKVVADK